MTPGLSSVPKKFADEPSDEALAAEILGYLAEDGERLSRFFALTGLTPESLRGASTEAGFAASLVEYLASDDRLFLAFAKERGHNPARLEAIRQRLGRPSEPDG